MAAAYAVACFGKYFDDRGVVLQTENEGVAHFAQKLYRRCGVQGTVISKERPTGLSTRHYLSQQLEAMLAEHDFHPHRALRKGANTIYIKAADHIEDLLTFMGAGGAAMRIMDQRVYNEMRNKTNRLSNCETANLGKSVQAAVQVQLAIEKLQAAGAMNTLPEALRHTAKLRMQYPDLPLAKLAQKFDPPVSKAGLSHRMKKIQEAAARLDTAPDEKETPHA